MKVFGKYEIAEDAEGAANEVFRGRDQILQREAFIKVFSTQGMANQVKQRLYKDVESAAKLTHPNIATVYNFGEQDNSIYVAMEELDGESLRQFVDQQRFSTLEAKIQFMVEVCDGLAFAHANEVIHRGVKPTNIFVLKSGRPKILDFATASAINQRSSSNGSNGTEYLAPEQLQGQKGDARSDIYSACVVFFELLTYKTPSADKDHNPEGDRFPLITELNPLLPQKLASVIAKGLSGNIANRYQTITDLAADLRKASVEVFNLSAKLAKEVVELRSEVLNSRSKLETGADEDKAQLAGIDLSVVDRINPEIAGTVTSKLHYLQLVELHEQANAALKALSELTAKTQPAIEPPTDATTNPEKQAPSIEDKVSEITLATKIGDVRDILALAQEIQDHKKQWFETIPSGDSSIETVESACRNALDTAVQILQSRIHGAVTRGDLAAAQEDFRQVEQICAIDAHYDGLSMQISDEIRELAQRQERAEPRKRLPSTDRVSGTPKVCPSCGKSNAAEAVFCESCSTRLAGASASRRLTTVAPTQAKARIVQQQTRGQDSQGVGFKTLLLVGAGVALLLLAGVVGYFLFRGGNSSLGEALLAKATALRPTPEDSATGPVINPGAGVEFLDKLPDAKDGAWVHVRLRTDGREGFIRNSDLESVNTKNADFDLWHARISISDANRPPESELAKRLSQIEKTMGRYSDKVPDDLRLAVADGYAHLSRQALPDKPLAKDYAGRAGKYMAQVSDRQKHSERVNSVQVALNKIAEDTIERPVAVAATDGPKLENGLPDAQKIYDDAKARLEKGIKTRQAADEIIAQFDKIIRMRFEKSEGKKLKALAEEQKARALGMKELL